MGNNNVDGDGGSSSSDIENGLFYVTYLFAELLCFLLRRTYFRDVLIEVES